MDFLYKHSSETPLAVFLKENAVDEVVLLTALGNKADKKAIVHSTFRDSYYLSKIYPFTSDINCRDFRRYANTSIQVTFLQLKQVKKWLSSAAINLSTPSSEHDRILDEYMVKNTQKRLIVRGDPDFGYYLQHQHAIEEIQELYIDVQNEEKVEEDDDPTIVPPAKLEVQWKDDFGTFYFGKSTNKKMFLANMSKYIASKDEKKVEPPKRKRTRRVTVVPETDDELDIEVNDLSDITKKRKNPKCNVDKDDMIIIGLLFSCMYLNDYKDIIDAVVNFDSGISSACQCSTNKLSDLLKKYGSDNLNTMYVEKHETVKCCVEKANIKK